MLARTFKDLKEKEKQRKGFLKRSPLENKEKSIMKLKLTKKKCFKHEMVGHTTGN